MKDQNAVVCAFLSAAGSILDLAFSAEDRGRYRTFPDTALFFRLRLFAGCLLLRVLLF
jgi:hypothetical protein